MTREDIEDLFAPFGEVTTRAMFGGLGIYHRGLIFAIEADGEIYLKASETTAGEFEAAGGERFVYDASGHTAALPYWRLPADAHDDEDVLKHFCSLAYATAEQAAAAKQRKASSRRAGQAKGAA